ncbi:hypothetical protein HDV03_003857 [Kappamyces sp. JEL0829]|nr:hypothetical protein HDV03_003857 [Kappamyces sp. JEL0829]
MPHTVLGAITSPLLKRRLQWSVLFISLLFNAVFIMHSTLAPEGSHLAASSIVAAPTEGSPSRGENTDLISYVYYETEEAKRNLEFFIAHALHAKADFVFIMNSEFSVTIPNLPNVRVFQRDNSCFDMGAQKEVLSKIDTSRYKRFLLTNASIRGPFIPLWVENRCWSDKYFNRLNQHTKLVGMTANCNFPNPRDRHIQSMLLAFDRKGLDLVMDHFRCFSNYADAVDNGEIPLTAKFAQAGYAAETVAFVTSTYNGLSNKEYWERCSSLDGQPALDIHFPNNYFGMDLHPFDTMFVKVKALGV